MTTESQMREQSAHTQVCKSAASWLRTAKNCAIAAVELTAMANEKPDVIGFCSYDSHVIEVKMSRADFHRDKHKWHRKEAGRCMGDFRWYCCPTGVLQPEDMPPNWGLIYYDGKKCRAVVKAIRFEDSCIRTERAFLVSIARRLRNGCEFIGPKLGMKAAHQSATEQLKPLVEALAALANEVDSIALPFGVEPKESPATHAIQLNGLMTGFIALAFNARQALATIEQQGK